MKNEINDEADIARLIGEYAGTIMGIIELYDVTPDVKDRMRDKLKVLRNTKINLRKPSIITTPDRAFAYKSALMCVEYLINMTPTSEERNKMTDIHLQLLSLNT